MCCWNIAIYKWKVYNGKIEINFCHKISFSAGPHCQFRGIERQRRYKGVIRRRKSKKDRQYNGQKKDRQYNGQKKDRQYNGQKKKVKKTKNDLQHTRQKTKDRVTQTPVKQGMNSCGPE